MGHVIRYGVCLLLAVLCYLVGQAEDGSRLWLRYTKVADREAALRKIHCSLRDPVANTAVQELQHYWRRGDVALVLDKKWPKYQPDGYRIWSVAGKTIIRAGSSTGLLYGAYHLLRLQQIGSELTPLDIVETPSYHLRMLNHWDNLDGTVERGYAGYSLWKWDELPAVKSPRYVEYARANASIGINAVVLNNVNASPLILREDYIEKVKALADSFRPYGIRVFLSINFSAPAILGNLQDSDPLNPAVARWWKDKADAIYSIIPDFGGFLVKANSEGQPGPQDYGRTHADGANMLATALRPHKGLVLWRAFVYNPSAEDRAKQAYQEFVPLDGKFDDNVILQIKNGPIDFQPREPFNPLFGAMPKTSQMVEFQITQEYLGFSNHLVYLAPLFKETLDAETYTRKEASTVAGLTQKGPNPRLSAIAGVANIGEDRNWCGHHFAQANWYAFGRLAWNSGLSSDSVAREWLASTFSPDPTLIAPLSKVMLESREAAVNYMMPLGLHHIFAFEHHYGPEPWGDIPGGRPDWMPWYYHNADSLGIGFDRTASGSNAVAQYHSPLQEQFAAVSSCPEKYLLWFHHVPWSYSMKNGRSLWDNLCYAYQEGVNQVRYVQRVWDGLEHKVDAERFKDVQAKLKIQATDAVWWRDACLLYFQTYSRMPIPPTLEQPVHRLDELKKIKLNLKHHN
ncbi:alpha-glucuronidase [Sphingobacterium sp. 2149]|uniref:alpha-glucuronidase n=1 Tax=Sphingobacterium sp. 2149 TaxID=2817763 RepID=UPI00285F52D4|nr:alpha-glucuronidase [Sphingobacterium sp. 2149]MDR6734478.1 alpha-glucuronidase [Sphingobacterium sp. 2149]